RPARARGLAGAHRDVAPTPAMEEHEQGEVALGAVAARARTDGVDPAVHRADAARRPRARVDVVDRARAAGRAAVRAGVAAQERLPRLVVALAVGAQRRAARHAGAERGARVVAQEVVDEG